MRLRLAFGLMLWVSLATARLCWGDEAPAPSTEAAHSETSVIEPGHAAYEAPLAATEATLSECTYLAGRETGQKAAKQEGSWGWGAVGAGTACAAGMLGCFTLGPVLGAGCGGMGCLAASGAGYLVGGEAEVVHGGCYDNPDFASGYAEGYEKTIATQNALYAFAGGVIGSVAAVPLSLTLFFTALLGGAAL